MVASFTGIALSLLKEEQYFSKAWHHGMMVLRGESISFISNQSLLMTEVVNKTKQMPERAQGLSEEVLCYTRQ